MNSSCQLAYLCNDLAIGSLPQLSPLSRLVGYFCRAGLVYLIREQGKTREWYFTNHLDWLYNYRKFLCSKFLVAFNIYQANMVTASKLHQTEKTNKYLLKSTCWLLAVLLGALQTWANRYSLWPDAVSYLDISDAYMQGDWNAAINACWSPLYSWVLGLALLIFKPSPYDELLVIKLVNFLIYILTLVSFEFFLCELIHYYQNKITQDSQKKFLRVPEWIWIVLGYTLFIWSSTKWLVVYRDAPDTIVAALVYLAVGLVLRLYTSSQSRFNFLALGIVLGIGYLSKSIMLPLALVLLVTSLFSASNLQQTLPRGLAALLVFTIISAPFIAALSFQKGRLTFGDAGKLNYAWYVSPMVEEAHWQGLPPGSGTPKHPTRKIFNNPAAFEFATPVAGTFPPWYDPSYWNEGLKPTFNPILQVKAIAKNIIFCYELFLGSLILSYLILVCVSGRFPQFLSDLMVNWRLLLPAIVGLGGFIVMTTIGGEVQPWGFWQTRYIAPFVVLLFAGVFTSVRLPNSQESNRLVLGLTIATLFLTGSQLSYQAAKDLGAILRQPQHIHWQIAKSLNQLGIQPGEKIAIIGQDSYYWARLSKVKIVASIPYTEAFWKADAVTRSEALKAIEKTGVRAIIQQPESRKIPDSAFTTGWQEIGNSSSYVYFLPQGR